MFSEVDFLMFWNVYISNFVKGRRFRIIHVGETKDISVYQLKDEIKRIILKRDSVLEDVTYISPSVGYMYVEKKDFIQFSFFNELLDTTEKIDVEKMLDNHRNKRIMYLVPSLKVQGFMFREKQYNFLIIWKNGIINKMELFKDCVLISRLTFNTEGNIFLSKIEADKSVLKIDNKGKIVKSELKENSTVDIIVTKKNNKLLRLYTQILQDGLKKKCGFDISFYDNGKIQFIISYCDEICTGPCVSFDEFGQVMSEGYYTDVDGKFCKNGAWSVKNKSELIEEGCFYQDKKVGKWLEKANGELNERVYEHSDLVFGYPLPISGKVID